MAELFTKDYALLWAAVLAAALFFPVRQLIWILLVRRAQSRSDDVDEAVQLRLKHRAGATSALLCFIFSIVYTFQLFKDG